MTMSNRTKKSWLLPLLCVLVALGWSSTSFAQGGGTYSVDAGSGGQAQIGDGLPIPIQLATTGGTMMNPIGTGTVFPPLLVPPATGATVMQQVAADAFKMTVAPGAFKRIPSGAFTLGVVPNNPTVFQVRTNLSLSGPGVFPINSTHTMNTMTFVADGRTLGVTTGATPTATMAGPNTTTFMGEPSASSFARYFVTGNRFGGPSQTKVIALSDVWVWANGQKITPPCKHPSFGGTFNAQNLSCAAAILIANPAAKGVAGGPIGTFQSTTPPVAMSPGIAQLSITTAQGTIAQSLSVAKTAPVTNMAVSVGFPWTTGALELEQSTAQGSPEKFKITGDDGRNAFGTGTLSLVAGALSNRQLSGENANRGWARYVLPEPTAVLGAGAALAVLALCHALVRRQNR
jgi:hypothetical protein